MPVPDLHFLQRRIAREADHLHAVEEGLRDGGCGIGRADKEDMREIIGHIQVMVRKRAVLLGVEDFEQRARRIALHGLAELVHLVEHHDRVAHAALVNGVHDASRHCPDVRAPVAADIRLIAHTAEAHARIGAVHGIRDGFPDAGLARARTAHKEQDRARDLSGQVHNRDLFNDTVLGVLEAVVVLFKALPCLLQINRLPGRCLPGECGHEIQIV